MITVGVIEDHPVFLDGLRHVVESSDAIRFLDAWGSVEEALTTRSGFPHVMLLDLHLPGLSGPDAVHAVHERGSNVLVVSAATNRDDVLDAISAGALGYLSKESHPEEILSAIHEIAGGGTYVSATLAAYLLDAHRTPDDAAGLNLTERETEILVHLAHGERDQDIADLLFISVRTVRSHLDRIRDKTGRRRRPDLTRLALESGLLDPQ